MFRHIPNATMVCDLVNLCPCPCRAIIEIIIYNWPRNMAKLFTAFKLRETVFKNRIFVSPMCQYSAVEGMANPWHMVHLGTRAVGGAALVMVEATAVSAVGRI